MHVMHEPTDACDAICGTWMVIQVILLDYNMGAKLSVYILYFEI